MLVSKPQVSDKNFTFWGKKCRCGLGFLVLREQQSLEKDNIDKNCWQKIIEKKVKKHLYSWLF